MVEYALKRTRGHLHRFTRLYDDIKNQSVDEQWLAEIEKKANLFPEINFRVYAG